MGEMTAREVRDATAAERAQPAERRADWPLAVAFLTVVLTLYAVIGVVIAYAVVL